jgi:hypothetical protein
MVRQAFRLGWLWVALYAIGGAFCLLFPAALWAGLADDTSHFLSAGTASLVGAALVSRFAQGMSIREGMVAALVMGCGISLVSLLPRLGAHMHQVGTYTHLFSTLILCTTGALAGGRMGAIWSRYSAFAARTPSAALMAGVVLIGAFACHTALVILAAQVSHGLAVFVSLISLFVTPAFAGAALQLGQHQAVERQVGMGIALIAGTLLFFVAMELQSVGSVSLIAIALLGLGATIYSITLPGVIAVRSSRLWKHRCNDVPLAVVVQETD